MIPLPHEHNLQVDIDLPNLLSSSLVVYRLVPTFDNPQSCAGKPQHPFAPPRQSSLSSSRCTTPAASPAYIPPLRNALLPPLPLPLPRAHPPALTRLRPLRPAPRPAARARARSVRVGRVRPGGARAARRLVGVARALGEQVCACCGRVGGGGRGAGGVRCVEGI